MTDDFENLIRSAGRGLGSAGETPTYHEAYKRGQRRRFVRRAAMTTAGACVVVLAFVVSVGPFGSGESTEVADIVTSAVEATSSATVPTTAPVLSVPTSSDDTTVAPDLDVPDVNPVATPPLALPQPSAQPTSAPQPTAPIVTAVPLPDPPSTVETIDETIDEPEATPVPTPTEAPIVSTADPVETVEPTDVTDDPTAVAGVSVFGGSAVAQDEGPAAGAVATNPAPVDPDARAPTSTQEPDSTATATSVPAAKASAAPDAVVLVDVGLSRGATTLLCDTDFDGATDSNCELLTSYACSTEAEAREGFVANDTDGDGVLDTCVPTGDLQCQATSRGTTSRVPCLIYQVFD